MGLGDLFMLSCGPGWRWWCPPTAEPGAFLAKKRRESPWVLFRKPGPAGATQGCRGGRRGLVGGRTAPLGDPVVREVGDCPS